MNIWFEVLYDATKLVWDGRKSHADHVRRVFGRWCGYTSTLRKEIFRQPHTVVQWGAIWAPS